MRQLGHPQATGHDRRRDQRPVWTRHLEEHLDLLARQARPAGLCLLELLDLAFDWVAR
jgi:hypothetical protein